MHDQQTSDLGSRRSALRAIRNAESLGASMDGRLRQASAWATGTAVDVLHSRCHDDRAESRLGASQDNKPYMATMRGEVFL